MATKSKKAKNLSQLTDREIEILEQKEAKREWKKKMKKRYPDFTTKKWAQTSYRINHPQH